MLLTTLALIATSSAGPASPDVETTLILPSSTMVYEVDTYEVEVANVGKKNANSVSLSIQLPETNTSPGVYVMGEVTGMDSRCSASGTTLQCNLGRLNKGQSTTVSFDMYLPWSGGTLDFSATASTSGDNNSGNDSDSDVASQTYDSLTITPSAAATNQHCTGQGLEAYYECTLFPSSISSHQISFDGGGIISFVGAPAGYTGVWSQASSEELTFSYSYDGDVVANFSGNAVDGDCFEGLTTFPGSPWIAPYEVCLD